MKKQHMKNVKKIIEETSDKARLKKLLMSYAVNNLEIDFRYFKDNYVRPLIILEQLSPQARERVIKTLRMRGFES